MTEVKVIVLIAAFVLIFGTVIWYFEERDLADLTRRAIVKRLDNLDERLHTIECRHPTFNEPIIRPTMLSKIEDEDFALWAFGDAWQGFLAFDYDAVDLVHAWNDLHGDTYRVEETDVISESLEAMKEIYEQTMEEKMDKKMHKVTESIKVAEKDIKKGQPKAAVKVLKGAEKKNEKLVKIDKNVRDPIIEKAKKLGKTVKKARDD